MQESPLKFSQGSLVLLGLLFFVYPFGPAFQNIGMGLFVLTILGLRYPLLAGRLQTVPREVLWFFGSILAFLVWNVIATLISPSRHHSEPWTYFLGYLPLVLLPWMSGALPRLEKNAEQKLLSWGSALVLIWGLVALSQYFFPWRWAGTSIIPHDNPRAQGFYSHPMSLAYASLILWPLAVRMLLNFPRLWQSWCLAVGTALLLFFSMSRVAQGLAAVFALWNIFTLLSGRQRLMALSFTVALGSLLAVTENPVSVRFRHLLHPAPEELMSDYPDDRVAFWHAHLLMIEERPLTGHGVHLGLAFRKPYYERLGLQDFPKKYQAHNQYLQILAESGLIGLLLYGSWLAFACLMIRRFIKQDFIRGTVLQSLLIFSLGCLTQNAFDDTCVRMGLIMLFCLLLVKMPAAVLQRPRAVPPVPHPGSPRAVSLD